MNTPTPTPTPQPGGNEQKKASRALLLTMAVVMIVVAGVAIYGFLCLNRPADALEGQFEGTTVRISGIQPGRVVKLYVQEGDTVQAGDTLVHIHSAVVDAQKTQAQAMEQAAAAQNRKVDAGTRIQIIQGAADMVAQAQAAVSITRKTYDRMENLYSQGVVSEQKRDEAKAAYDAATAQLSAAQSQLSLARQGAQQEDKESAQALVNAARGQVGVVDAVLEDSYLIAPCNGTIDQIFPEQSELVSLGAPIMNILKDDRHFVINVRETLLPDFAMGREIDIQVPGLKDKTVKARVYYVRDKGTYATWRATKSEGSYDTRTFEIKARPIDDDNARGLRPGMSGLVK